LLIIKCEGIIKDQNAYYGSWLCDFPDEAECSRLKEPSSKCSGKATKGEKAIVVKLDHNCGDIDAPMQITN